jgi:hypothetical protein
MRTVWIGALAFLFVGPAPSGAESDLEARVEVLTEELRRLKESLALPDTDEELEARHGLAPAASRVYGRSGLSIGGYGELYFEQPTGDGDAPRTGDFLRLVTYFGYKFSDRIVLNTEIEFEHGNTEENHAGEAGEVALEQGYLDFLLDDAVNVRAGEILVPMGFVNRIHEPPFFRGVARPEVERRLLPTTWRELGVGLHGEAAPGLHYEAYLMSGLDANGFGSTGIRGGRQSANRVLWEDSGTVLALDLTSVRPLRLGGSVYHGGADHGRPFDGAEASVTVTITEAHAEVKRGGFEGRALVTAVRINEAGAVSRELSDSTSTVAVPERQEGWYLEGAYDVAPWMGIPDNAQLFAWIRYEDWDLQKEVAPGFTRDPARDGSSVAFGLELKPHPSVSVKADLTVQDSGAGGETDDPFRLGVGFVF